ncbi:hypothetical protein PPIS_a4295 [Pseudoalteromonas piscicida]|uniref:Uncharacterized protein n=1 Tax=Pseudoalteromonas piscicida TaxID=43662 RepID=A0ABM6NJ33_PSEO7|nr:hypothetical protein PPIS_a4295 [Pseudoalteromonas piscicida]
MAFFQFQKWNKSTLEQAKALPVKKANLKIKIVDSHAYYL